MKPFLLLATRAEDVAADGEYAAMCRYGRLHPAQLHRVRLEAGPMPSVDLDAYSGIIVGGGPFNSSDPDDQKSEVQHRVEREMADLLEEVVDRDFPFLGACYGVGTLGTFAGGVVDRHYGEDVGIVTVELTREGAEDPLLEGVPPAFAAFAGHKEAMRELPPGAVRLAFSPWAPVQMFRLRENLYATQFHPELDLAGLTDRVRVYRHHGYFDPEEAGAVIARASARPVTEPMRILRNFVTRYARD
ncbi:MULTISPECIES: glutamine amidotransferase [unclassified Isoptericola]|uniref:glutamine amidotransferase n=1 Tax=unclassified Isoptericola TaxID=2623355 RepID=UPI0027131695|nr:MULTISPECIES: glutamine amidotransferase [unclassified Isoptericola]MDO8145589.1 glutamine amidotransferase [Isoptericola sp. 178]MDO8149215.1 glutamine amidotransferase [Isoptericola sp. b515]MDO8152154.1 glutamine amidotransferase [Isoptericola sp. b408]